MSGSALLITPEVVQLAMHLTPFAMHHALQLKGYREPPESILSCTFKGISCISGGNLLAFVYEVTRHDIEEGAITTLANVRVDQTLVTHTNFFTAELF